MRGNDEEKTLIFEEPPHPNPLPKGEGTKPAFKTHG
jgi:hypothetical protein